METIIAAAMPKLVEITLALVGGLAVALWRKVTRRAEIDSIIMVSIEAAVSEAYEEFVRDIKKKIENDGKLTRDERRSAQELALQKAVAIASENGVELLDYLSERAIKGMIDSIVQEKKAVSRGDVTIIAPE